MPDRASMKKGGLSPKLIWSRALSSPRSGSFSLIISFARDTSASAFLARLLYDCPLKSKPGVRVFPGATPAIVVILA